MKNDQTGFSLMEVMVVVSVFCFLAVLGIPNFLEWRKSQELRGAADEISSVLMQARMESIMKRANHTVTFDPAGESYLTTKWLQGAASSAGGSVAGKVSAPWKNVDIYDDDTDPACPKFYQWKVTFRPNSTADTTDPLASPDTDTKAVYIRAAGIDLRYRVKVFGVTGKINVERWLGGAWVSAY